MSNIHGPSTSVGRQFGRQQNGNQGDHRNHQHGHQQSAQRNSRSNKKNKHNRSAKSGDYHHQQQRTSNQNIQPLEVEQVPVQLAGMTWDPIKKKYFTIAPENSGIDDYTQSAIVNRHNHQLLEQRITENREMRLRRPVVRSLAMLTNRGQLGLMSAPQMQRRVFESRLMAVKDAPNYIVDVKELFGNNSVKTCSFLSVAGDGRSLFGCWSISRRGYEGSLNNCLSVSIDEESREKALLEQDRQSSDSEIPLNTMGLSFAASPQFMQVSAPEVVDMRVARVDSEVTTCLYVTANTRFHNNQLRSTCNVLMYPLSEWCTPENVDILNSPIYNHFWSESNHHIWSCGWSSRKNQISLGLEANAKIVDIITDASFMISSRNANVLSQEFSPDGNLIYMGLDRRDAICSDLRMPKKHIVSDFKDTANALCIHSLKSYEHHVLTQTFDGKISLWDTRQMSSSMLTFEGHMNSFARLPCVVDSKERFLFAVSQDGCTRGWSLHSGELLCELSSSQPLRDRSGFPRVAYSDCWGGRVGNSALLIAAGSSVRVHQLDL